MIEVRDAVTSDAGEICRVVRRAIVELCGADHLGDPTVIRRWLDNKTPENVVAWIRRQDNSVLVATEQHAILAAGSVTDAGEITLNYVSPDARFRGVSRTLMRALERRAGERGNRRCFLNSTETAHRFYLASGYVDDGAPVHKFGATGGYPMSKTLEARQGSDGSGATV